MPYSLLLCCLLGTAHAAEPVLLVLGDSLSAAYGFPVERGWVQLLEQRLRSEGQPYRVVNVSVSGETTQGVYARLPRILARHRPRVVIVEIGGNDGLRGLPLATIQDNLTAIVQSLKRAGARILLTGIQLPPNYGPSYTSKFAAIYAQVAQDQQVALVPFLLADVAANNDLMQNDGIHPRAAAQPRILDNVWPHLAPLLQAPAARAAPAAQRRP